MTKKNTYEVPAVVKALDILEYLNKHSEASLTNIYTDLVLPKSSTYHILSTLENKGYVRRLTESGKYCLGLKLFEMGTLALSRIDIIKEAKPILVGLANETGQTCHMGILDDTEAVYLDKVESDSIISMNTWIGMRGNLYCTGIGKALLAWQDEKTIYDIVSRINFIKLTEKTITSENDFKEHLKMVKERGYSMDDEENQKHIKSVGVPIIDINGNVIAAISVAGLANDLKGQHLKFVIKQVKHASKILSSQIRGN